MCPQSYIQLDPTTYADTTADNNNDGKTNTRLLAP